MKMWPEVALASALQAAGRWTATTDLATVATAIAGVPIKGQFDRVLRVSGATARKLARCRRVPIVDESPDC